MIFTNHTNFVSLSILFSFALVFSQCKQEVEPDPEPPSDELQVSNQVTGTNILLIIGDDIGVDPIASFAAGNEKATTPVLQYLMENGISYENAWANPVCAPTRASIMTGKYGFRTNVLNATELGTLDDAELSIADVLDRYTNDAYVQGAFGKWHISGNDKDGPQALGFDHFVGTLGGGIPDYNNWSLTMNGETQNETDYFTSFITDHAIDWIDQQTKPWLCWMAYTAAHTPFHLPPSDLHYQDDLPLDQASIDANPLPYYLAMIESLDTEMGRLLNSLPDEVRNNTLVIYIGDNGSPGAVAQSPYTNSKSKGSIFQGGVHVPFVAYGKGVNRMNVRESGLVHVTDLFTTIAEASGIEAPVFNDSYSLKESFSGTDKIARVYNYAEVVGDNANKSGNTIRNAKYKLNNSTNGNTRMFDLLVDPFETNNLLNGNVSDDAMSALAELESALAEIKK